MTALWSWNRDFLYQDAANYGWYNLVITLTGITLEPELPDKIQDIFSIYIWINNEYFFFFFSINVSQVLQETHLL